DGKADKAQAAYPKGQPLQGRDAAAHVEGSEPGRPKAKKNNDDLNDHAHTKLDRACFHAVLPQGCLSPGSRVRNRAWRVSARKGSSLKMAAIVPQGYPS